MSHMVIYRSVEGQPVFHQVENLEDAARHVETLRNGGEGDDARIFAMKEVKIEVKTYYRVEVASDEPPAAPAKPVVAADTSAAAASTPPVPAGPAASAAPAEPPAPPVATTPAAVKPEPAVAGAAANGGRFGLFGKG